MAAEAPAVTMPVGRESAAFGPWFRRSSTYSVLYILAGLVEIVPRQHAVFHTIWLPGGIAVAALILCGLRFLPFLFCAHVITRVISGYAWDLVAVSALVATAQGAIAYLLLQRARFNPALRTVRDTMVLVACAAALPCLICCGAAYWCHNLSRGAADEPFFRFCVIYSMRGAAGVVATAPILLAFGPGRRAAWLASRKLEFVAATALTTITAAAIFFNSSSGPPSGSACPAFRSASSSSRLAQSRGRRSAAGRFSPDTI